MTFRHYCRGLILRHPVENAAGKTPIPIGGGSKMMNRRKKDSTVREDQHGRGPGVRIGSRLTTTAFACVATIALAIVAFANAGQVGAITRWAGDSEFGAPFAMSVAHVADPAPESATRSLTDGVLDVPELSHPLLPEGCGLVASITGLGESAYTTPPQDHDCPPEVTVEKRDYFGCFLNIFGDDRRCMFPLTCDLDRVYERSRTVKTDVGHGVVIETTETEDMCGYGDCGNFNVAAVPQ